ncbi:MAG: 30S ribosomal protein S6 [Alphaproteobacteria bacterium]|nr:30S ribosomal protein S6 [Alphaproteobacteria bacterium]
MAVYETVLILRQDLTPAQVDENVAALKGVIDSEKGKVLKEENWGLRSLAYKIKKNKKGHYILLETSIGSSGIKELERKLSLNESVLRYMSVKREAPSKAPSIILTAKERDEKYRDDKFERRGA